MSTIINSVDSYCFVDLPEDPVGQVFEHSWLGGEILSMQSLACTNWHFNRHLTPLMKRESLCPRLTIVSAEDAEKYGFPAKPAALFSKFKLMDAYRLMAPHVEDGAGAMYFDFTLPEELTLQEIVTIAQGQGIDINMGSDQVLPALGATTVQTEFPCLLSNSMIKESRSESFEAQRLLVEAQGYTLPTAGHYLVQAILTQKIFSKSCVGLWTYGRALASAPGSFLLVGGSHPIRLNVMLSRSSAGFDFAGVGAACPVV